MINVKATGSGASSGQQSPQQPHINVRTLNVQDVRVLNQIQLGDVSLNSFSVQSLFKRMAAFERQAGKLQEELRSLGGGESDTCGAGGNGGGNGGAIPPSDTTVIQRQITNLQVQVDGLHEDLNALRIRVSSLERTSAAQQLFLNDTFERIPTQDV